jgi:hypothetical protein
MRCPVALKTSTRTRPAIGRRRRVGSRGSPPAHRGGHPRPCRRSPRLRAQSRWRSRPSNLPSPRPRRIEAVFTSWFTAASRRVEPPESAGPGNAWQSWALPAAGADPPTPPSIPAGAGAWAASCPRTTHPSPAPGRMLLAGGRRDTETSQRSDPTPGQPTLRRSERANPRPDDSPVLADPRHPVCPPACGVLGTLRPGC